jgi:hypothetical protein
MGVLVKASEISLSPPCEDRHNEVISTSYKESLHQNPSIIGPPVSDF